MNVGQVIFDFVIPIMLIIFGTYFRKKPIKRDSVLFGHRTPRAKQSEEAWNYAHQRLGPLWQKTGIILFVIIGISYFINPLAGEDLNRFHFILGVISVFIPSVMIETDLKRKFGDPGEEKERIQGLRQNKKVKKKQTEKEPKKTKKADQKKTSKKPNSEKKK